MLSLPSKSSKRTNVHGKNLNINVINAFHSALALSGLRFTNKEHQSKGNVGLTTPHKNLNTMAKGSGGTRTTTSWKENLIDKIIKRDKFLLIKEAYREGVTKDIQAGKSKEEILNKWYYSEKSSAPTSGGTREYITKNGTFEVKVVVSKVYRASAGRIAVKDKTRTVTIRKNGKVVYDAYLSKDNMKEYRKEFKKIWE